MDTATLLQTAQTILAPFAERTTTPEPCRIDIYLPAERIAEAVAAMQSAERWHMVTITGLDIPQTHDQDGSIELLYHFCQGAAIVTLRICVSYGEPIAPTICGIIPSATLYEREVMEMFGVFFDGTPSRDRLLLPDDWPDWVYPMRKSFTGLEKNEVVSVKG